MPADIRMRRNGNKVFVEAQTPKGANWLIVNVVAPRTVHYTIDYELIGEMERTFRDAGLEVEGP